MALWILCVPVISLHRDPRGDFYNQDRKPSRRAQKDFVGCSSPGPSAERFPITDQVSAARDIGVDLTTDQIDAEKLPQALTKVGSRNPCSKTPKRAQIFRRRTESDCSGGNKIGHGGRVGPVDIIAYLLEHKTN